jgi:threonine dehydrogenase-like Zn-dependent dehydrogenase
MVVEEVPIPVLSEPGQVLIQNLVSTICGSDVHNIFGEDPPPAERNPGYPGHEAVGVVTASSDPSFTAGDLVLAVPPLRYAGGFAEYQLLPSRHAIPLPPDSSPEQAILAQQLGTVIYGMKRFWPGAGHGTAVVLGAGPVGLFFTRLCRLAGFTSVITSDLHPDRLDVAAAMGATSTVLATGDAVVEAVHDATGGAGAALVVEAAGTDVTGSRPSPARASTGSSACSVSPRGRS